MPFECPKLPYDDHALEPFISGRTIAFHYGKHHRSYVNKLNALIDENPVFKGKSLEEMIREQGHTGGAIFNNAAQAWNHGFYWHCLAPKAQGGGGEPSNQLAEKIKEKFDSLEVFKEKFSQKAMSTFGSGWVWLVQDKRGELEIVSTSNAGNPMVDGQVPLLTCDVWEHAYYLDTQNNRGQYLKNFWQVINWDFVAENLG